MLNHRVIPAIRRQHYEPIMWEINPEDPHHYRNLLGSWFEAISVLGDLAIVEHDVESRTGFLHTFEECPEPYCFHAYHFAQSFDDSGLDYAPLGHTRFRATIQAELTSLIESERWRTTPHYGDLDGIIGHHLGELGIGPHRHEGDVIHHHKYDD
jgi:hypothetical protein